MNRVQKLRSSLSIAVATALWLCVCAAGFGALMRYSTKPGARGASPAGLLPTTLTSRPATETPAAPKLESGLTFTLFLHPHCPCSRASLKEFARLAREHPGAAEYCVWLVAPREIEPAKRESWALETELGRAGQAIPSATVAVDHCGEMAEAYGAATSGHAVLVANDGRVLFSGGLTSARGQEGQAAGGEFVASWLSHPTGAAQEPLHTPIFGCPLVKRTEDTQSCEVEAAR